MTNQQLTPEEIREKRRNHAISVLEHKAFQDVLGSNKLMSNPFEYGSLGTNGANESYNDAMSNPEVQSIRSDLMKEARQKGDQLGIYGEPSVGNYEIATKIAEDIETSKAKLSLEDLAKIVKGVAGDKGYKFDLPEEIKDYIPAELMVKIQEKSMEEGRRLDPREVLNQDEYHAFETYQRILSPAYDKGITLEAAQRNYFKEENALARYIQDYHKKEE